jgi:acetate kinase
VAILTINSGSSSLKFGLYRDDASAVLFEGVAKGVGSSKGSLVIRDGAGDEVFRSKDGLADQAAALAAVADHLQASGGGGTDGHRASYRAWRTASGGASGDYGRAAEDA